MSFTFYSLDILKSLFQPIPYIFILPFLFVTCVEIILLILRKKLFKILDERGGCAMPVHMHGHKDFSMCM